MPLEDLLTDDRPFGPPDQARIADRNSAVELLDLDEPFDTLTKRQYTLLYGRKGSGKSAAISLYNGFSHIADSAKGDDERIKDVNAKTIFVNIKTWDHFFDMNHLVQRALAERTGAGSVNDIDFDLVPLEIIEEEWITRIWVEIFQKFYGKYRDDEIPVVKIANVVALFEDGTLATLKGAPDYIASKMVSLAKDEILDYITQNNTSVCVLFDSMERYPVMCEAFSASMGGFLRAINAFQFIHGRTRAVFALPEELVHFFQLNSSNILKDFENAYPLRWNPEQLFRMAAHRYRLFLSFSDKSFFEQVVGLDLSKRSQLREFWSLILPKFIVNELGGRESTIAYLLRHTQLLPRHFIMHLNQIATLSREETDSWQAFTEDAILRGIANSELLIAKEILAPHEAIYRGLEVGLRSSMPGLPPIFSYGRLQKHTNRIKGRFDLEPHEFMALMYRAGIIGRINRRRTDIYDEAEFSFLSSSSDVLSSFDRLCFHPIFSRFFNCPNHRNGDTRIIYPSGVDREL